MTKDPQTHETYIQAVVEAAKTMVANDPASLKKLANVKICYGLGQPGLRGVTYYNKWTKDNAPADLIEVCAFGQSSWIQVAGTTIHELAHVLAGYGAGHDKEWKAACEQLGLRTAKAAGTNYVNAMFESRLRALLIAIPLPTDGSPQSVANALGIVPRAKPCSAGVGTRGGTSRGVGSGSRLIKCQCEKCGYTVRTTQKWIGIGLPICPTDNQPMKSEE